MTDPVSDDDTMPELEDQILELEDIIINPHIPRGMQDHHLWLQECRGRTGDHLRYSPLAYPHCNGTR